MSVLAQLSAYFERLRNLPDPLVPPPGFSQENLKFALILDSQGKLLGAPVPLGNPNEKGKLDPYPCFVPHPGGSRTSGIKPYFLWDKTDYILGVALKKAAKGKDPVAVPSPKHFAASRELLERVAGQSDDKGIRAVASFLKNWRPESFCQWEDWQEILGQNLAFKLEEEEQFVHERPQAQTLWRGYLEESEKTISGTCLVSGTWGPVQRLHGGIRGVPGAQSSGASLVSFNANSFCSYGKTQSYNAPVSKPVEKGYTAALNFLLARNSQQKIRIGDTMVVFWSEASSSLDTLFGKVLDNNSADDTYLNQKLHTLFQRFEQRSDQSALSNDIKADARFFVLGLAPNAARLSVRFWLQHTVTEMVARLKRHFDHLQIVRQFPQQPRYPGVSRLLLHLAAQRKFDQIPPTLIGEVLRAVFTAGPYPRSMFQAALTRTRVEGDITYERAALIKAWLLRNNPNHPSYQEVSMSLDPSRTDVPYRLGRLFAACEKAQEDSTESKLNRTVRERFFGSAMSTPAVVFPQLLRLNQFHLDKLRKSEKPKRNYQKLNGQICEGLGEFPRFLSLEEQGLFALGYYHQRQDLFKKPQSEEGSHE